MTLSQLTNAANPLTALLTAACGPSLAAMHDRAKLGAAQPDAPLHTKHSVIIDAPLATVWAVLTAVSEWPHWHPTIKWARAPGGVVEEASFEWNNKGTTLSSKFARVLPQQELVWTGSAFTAKGIHIWRLAETAPRSTQLEVEETMDGLLLTAFYSQAQLDQDTVLWLTAIKRESERQAKRP